jgi:hypothetical protein
VRFVFTYARAAALLRTCDEKMGSVTRQVRVIVVLVGTVATATSHAQQPEAWTSAEARADKQFTTYAYAHEFGSGVYDFNGRTLQVYGLPFAWTLRAGDRAGPGVRLKLPVTLGFLDFQASDVLSTGLPDGVDSVSFVPGFEFNFALSRNWNVLPYLQAGFSVADESNVETRLIGAGLRAESTFPARAFAGLYAGEVTYSGVEYRGDLPSDDFVRLRNSVEFTRGTDHSVGDYQIEWGLFAVLDVYADPPTGPTTGLDVPGVQIETGFIFGTRPGLHIWRVPLPRLGLSYRFAGDLSSIRFVIGSPF